MLFELKLGPGGALWGAVGKNGYLYWGARSVAKLLGYKNIYQFVRHRSTVRLKDIASEYHAREYRRYLETQLLSHNRLLSILDRSKKERAQLIYDHFNRGNFYVLIKKRPPYPRAELCDQSDPHSVNFFVWMEAFKYQLSRDEIPEDDDEEQVEEEEEEEEEVEAGTTTGGSSSLRSPPPPLVLIKRLPATAAAAAAAAAAEPNPQPSSLAPQDPVYADSPEYSPASPSCSLPPTQCSGTSNRRCYASTCVHCSASFQPSTSDFTPYSPSDPPYEDAEEGAVDVTIVREKPEPLDLTPSANAAAAAAAAATATLPFKKRFPVENESGVLVWFSSMPPKKIIVLQGNTSREFIPKMD